MSKIITLFIGPSGSGKSTTALHLQNNYGLKVIESYTTRPPRFAGEPGHIFVTEEDFYAMGGVENALAYVFYNGFHYWITPEQFEDSDIYIVDPQGAKMLLEKYQGQKEIKIVGFYAEEQELRRRMKMRGDSEEAITARIATDHNWFSRAKAGINYDFMVHTNGIVPTAEAVYEFIRYSERTSYSVKLFQINKEYDTERVKFLGSDALAKRGQVCNGKVCLNMNIYDQVFEGNYDFDSLEDVFQFFNANDRPRAWDYHSLSVSDVVEIKHNANPDLNGKWFVDSFGFKKIVDDVYLTLAEVEP